MIQGLHFVKSPCKGKLVRWYVYAWRGGPCIAKRIGGRKPSLTPDELMVYQQAVSTEHRAPAGTLLSLAREWRGNGRETASNEWKAFQPSTQETWGRQLDLIEAKWGDTPLALWNDPRMKMKIAGWRDTRSSSPRSADIGVTVLKALLKFGQLRGHLAVNVAADIPRLYHGGGREDIIWTDDDILRFADEAPQRILDGLILCSLTGLRRADLVALKWSEVGDHNIVRMAAKKSRGRRQRVNIPILSQTTTFLEELRSRPRAEGVETVLVDTRGRSWKAASFSAQFNAARDKAGIIDAGNPELGILPRKKHLHDMRGTFCTHLCHAGLTNEEIGRIMGWSPLHVAGIRQVYVDDTATVVALAKRIGSSAVKLPVKL